MAAGVPVVTTSNVNDGLVAQPGEDLLVGEDADEACGCRYGSQAD